MTLIDLIVIILLGIVILLYIIGVIMAINDAETIIGAIIISFLGFFVILEVLKIIFNFLTQEW